MNDEFTVQPVTLEDAVRVLNEVLEADPDALAKLLDIRVQCNERLADHPTFQVRQEETFVNGAEATVYSIGVLGLINALFGVIHAPDKPYHNYGPITLVSKASENGEKPALKLVGFVPTLSMWALQDRLRRGEEVPDTEAWVKAQINQNKR